MRSSSISPGAGAKSRSLSSALSRASMAWPTTGGGSPSSRSPAASRSCSFTRSSPVVASVTGCSTWRRAFTSMNTNCAVGLVVEELDRAGVGATHGLRQPSGRGADLGVLLARERRRRSFLEQLLVPPLHRAVPDPHGPDGAVVVGDDLDLDVAGPGQQPLEEHGVIAEGLPGLGLSRHAVPRSRSSALSTRRMPRPPPPADALISTG